MKYLVEVGARSFEIEVHSNGAVLIGGAERQAFLLAGPPGAAARRLVSGQRTREFGVQAADSSWRLSHGGHCMLATVLDSRQRAVRDMGASQSGRTHGGELVAPMPGLVVRVLAEEGKTVAAGAPLVVVEAMKMENELRAPVAGTVARLCVRPGDRVEKGAVLVEITGS